MPSVMPLPHIDPKLVFAWQAAHSIARGSPPPVHDRGGIRVDTQSETELKRWVFPHLCDGFREIAHSITAPRHTLKLCGTDEELRGALPDRWELQPGNHFMVATTACRDANPLPDGYRLNVHRAGAVTRACILSPDGDLAASGCAAETADAFIYDRIETAPDHRRKGLGIAVMAALGAERRSSATPQLLVATEDGRNLYAKLGWAVLAPIAAAIIPER
ncbi:GNAT family N-acetyltransferase [Lysobacter sp. LF1]|uniref:GNAT family N-acetyltransferase n=1 Tax=Lysobacter stagni TaxID=3045172 RepID=A0ABT6XIX9_9GAMM|nr:GNAT family N-acetyltransferase [Lysobacter sp. LF1]MDI9240117.1 GNAT family N-acetyltransferase [Lysobacter sp. LF1]